MMTKIHTLGSALLILVFTVASPLLAQATDYYVDTYNGSASDSNPGTSSLPWKTITKANQTLTAGDTAYIKAGTYSSYIAPQNSGTSTNPIMYRNYSTDIVTIQNAAYGIWLIGKSYITVQGINFYNLDQFMVLQNGANHNIIAYCNFDHGRSNQWTGSEIVGSSSYNWIHHSSFSNYGICDPSHGTGSGQGTTLDIGTEDNGADASSYNLIENNTLFHGGHHVMGIFSRYNTIRNNYFHNEAWSNGRGERNLYLNGVAAGTGHNLIEGNRFGYSSTPCNDSIPTVGSVAMSTSYNIFRHNKIYHSVAYGLGTYSYGSSYDIGSYNKIYNNTIFNSGYNIDPAYKGGEEDTAIWFASSANVGNQVKNNLYSVNTSVHRGYTTNQIFANNWNGDTQGNPLFVNASTTPPVDKTDATLPNLDLQSTSPAIDKVGSLTKVTSVTGTGTSITVSEASYFQDGSYGPAGAVQADWIAVGTISNIVQISSISGNTIKLASSISWTNGDSVWLYRKSDGVGVLYGGAPDAGAYEFQALQGKQPSAPNNLRIVTLAP